MKNNSKPLLFIFITLLILNFACGPTTAGRLSELAREATQTAQALEEEL